MDDASWLGFLGIGTLIVLIFFQSILDSSLTPPHVEKWVALCWVVGLAVYFYLHSPFHLREGGKADQKKKQERIDQHEQVKRLKRKRENLVEQYGEEWVEAFEFEQNELEEEKNQKRRNELYRKYGRNQRRNDDYGRY
jgi:hypothetical protein